jgi:phospholipid-translocating ATPase
MKHTGKRILAVGDGGNDVGMIIEANVGVGIAGKEGSQAANCSDFSITEFKNIVKLLLWHGRLIYTTSAKMSFFVFHRGTIIASMQFSFCIMFFLIDIPLFNGFLMLGYTTLFTNLPVTTIVSVY